MDNRITIGKIAKPQGLSGEVKVLSMTDDSNRFIKLKAVFVDGLPFVIKNVRVSNGVYIKLENIDSINDAIKLVGKFISIDREYAVKCKDNEYFIEDLINCTVFLDDVEFGTLIDVGQYGAADVHTVVTLDNRVVRYPFLKVLINTIDIINKKVCLIKEEFDRVCVVEKD